MDESIRIRTRAKIRSNLLGVLLIAGISCLGLVCIGVAVGVGVGLGTSGTTTTSAPPVIPPVTTTTLPIPPITTTLLPVPTTTTTSPTATSNPITTTTKTPIPITTTTEATTPTTEATTPTTEATTPTTGATTPTTEATTPTTEATTPTTEATTPTTEATTPTTEATTPTTEATTPTTEATTPTTETTTETTTTPTSTTSPPPKGFKISSQLIFDPSLDNPSSTDKSLLQESLRIKLNDVSNGSPFYIKLGLFHANNNTFSVVIYYDKVTDCSKVDCVVYFEKLKGIKLTIGKRIIQYTVSPPVDIATNLEPILEDEWEGIKKEKDKGEQIFDKKIDATCKAIGSVTNPDDAKKTLQAALCGILADTEIAPGVPFYIEAFSYNSAPKEFPITIYYKRPEVCAGGVCEQFINDKLKDIELDSKLKCTVNPPPTFNRVPVPVADFITDKTKEDCKTNNYELESSINIKKFGFKEPAQLVICTLIAEDPVDVPFYIEVKDFAINKYPAVVYYKGTQDGGESFQKFKTKLRAFQLKHKNELENLISTIRIADPTQPKAVTVKEWPNVERQRNICKTINEEISTKITFERNNAVESDKDELQKALCKKIEEDNAKNGVPYYIEVSDFDPVEKEFKAVIYYQRKDGVLICKSDKNCEKYLKNNLKNVQLTVNNKQLVYTVQSIDTLKDKLEEIQVGKWIETIILKKEKCGD